jgi:hypothetical protein
VIIAIPLILEIPEDPTLDAYVGEPETVDTPSELVCTVNCL